MDFANTTSFSALSYDIDVRGKEFHVIVARGTFELSAAPTLEAPERDAATPRITHVAEIAAEQAGLVVSDAYYGEMNRSSVKLESDLAQQKPRCDVIVIGSAHSPTGEPQTRIDVGISLRRLAPIANLARAGTLLEHRLAVFGARSFERKGKEWIVSDPEPFVELPLRYEHTFGGELKVYPEDDAAKRIDGAHRLSDEARKGHPEGDAAPLAHTISVENPVGVGFLQQWYAKAAAVDRWPAPRIEAPGAGITAEIFTRMIQGEARAGELPELSPQGVGVIAKPWQPRLMLAGTFDERWLAEDWPAMPPDFDMAYWNGAHRDMQCEHLFGGELMELINLLPRRAPRVVVERAGTACRFRVPEARVVVQNIAKGGAVTFAAPPIDTLILDLDEMHVSLVWRSVTPASLGIESACLFAVGDPKHGGTV